MFQCPALNSEIRVQEKFTTNSILIFKALFSELTAKTKTSRETL